MTKQDEIKNVDIATDPAFNAYRELKAKLDELYGKQSAAKERESELREAIRRQYGSRQFAGAESAEQARRVRDLLGMDDDISQDETELREALRAALDERRTIDLAIDKQQKRVAAAHHAAATEVRTRLTPQHESLAKDIVDALKQLRDALSAETDFQNQLDWKRIHFGPPLLTAAIPLSWDKCERIETWLREFAQGEGRYKLD